MIRINLKELLDARKMSIRELSNRLDYRFETIRQLCNNDVIQVRLDLIERICKELNCGLEDLITIVEDGGANDERETV